MQRIWERAQSGTHPAGRAEGPLASGLPAAQAMGLHHTSGCTLPAKGAGGSPGGYCCAGRGAELGSGMHPCSLPCSVAVP